MKKVSIIPMFFFLLFAFNAYGFGVFVSTEPQHYIVEKIGGKNIEITSMLPAGADPHTFSPKIESMRKLSKASIYFTMGFAFEENILPKIAGNYPQLTIVDMTKGIDYLTTDDGDAGHAHSEIFDTHTWLSPRNMGIMAANALNVLVSQDRANSEFYHKNYVLLIDELKKIDESFNKLFTDHKGIYFLEYHPSLGYFARDYGLQILAIEREGKSPKISELRDTIKIITEKNAKIFIITPTQKNNPSVKALTKEVKLSPQVLDIFNKDWNKTMGMLYSIFERGK